MGSTAGREARRELTVVVALALAGVALGSAVALGPWQPSSDRPGPAVVRIQPPTVTGGGAAGLSVGAP